MTSPKRAVSIRRTYVEIGAFSLQDFLLKRHCGLTPRRRSESKTNVRWKRRETTFFERFFSKTRSSGFYRVFKTT